MTMSSFWEETFENLRIDLTSGESVHVDEGQMILDWRGLRVWYHREVGNTVPGFELYPQGLIKNLSWQTPRQVDGI